MIPRRIMATVDDVRPMCAVCRRQVDSMRTERCVRSARTRIEVRCHGDVESFWLTDEFWRSGDVRVGEAFAERRAAIPEAR